MNTDRPYSICDADSIAPGWAHPFTLEWPDRNGVSEPLAILIVRDKKQNYFAYRNLCPHQGQTRKMLKHRHPRLCVPVASGEVQRANRCLHRRPLRRCAIANLSNGHSGWEGLYQRRRTCELGGRPGRKLQLLRSACRLRCIGAVFFLEPNSRDSAQKRQSGYDRTWQILSQ